MVVSAIMARAFPPHWKSLLALLLGLRAASLTRSSYLLRFVIILCALNWRNIPFIWHARCFLHIPLYRLRLALVKRGLVKPPRGARGKELGLKGIERGLVGIGRSPFDVVQASDEYVSLADADFNMHMSNSSYLTLGDFNRFRCAILTAGPAFAREGITVALAETRYCFLREIPIFSTFRHEVRFAAWDSQWFYFYIRFLIPVTKRARANPSFIKVKDSRGRDYVLAACGMARMCTKLPGHPRSLHPGRVFVMGGCGVDASNWQFAKELRRKRQAKKWLLEDGTPEGMLPYEKKRIAQLEAIQNVSDKASWIALDALLCAENGD